MGDSDDERVLPPYVSGFLKRQQVDPSDLPDEVFELFAGMCTGELALIELVGTTLQEAGADPKIIVKVH